MRDLETLLKEPAILVSVQDTKGSTPRGTDAFMVVGVNDFHGTIGGGQLEFAAIDQARKMLKQGLTEHTIEMPLGPETGQCCGGRVALDLTLIDDTAKILARARQDLGRQPSVYVFGTGHVGKALCRSLSLLPVTVHAVESRESELSGVDAPVNKHLLAMPETIVATAPSGAAFVTMTHDHALDFVILTEIMKRDDVAYIGMIGSRSKRMQFERWYEREGGNRADCVRLTSPIGGPSGDKRPAVIAAYVATELMRVFERASLTERYHLDHV